MTVMDDGNSSKSSSDDEVQINFKKLKSKTETITKNKNKKRKAEDSDNTDDDSEIKSKKTKKTENKGKEEAPNVGNESIKQKKKKKKKIEVKEDDYSTETSSDDDEANTKDSKKRNKKLEKSKTKKKKSIAEDDYSTETSTDEDDEEEAKSKDTKSKDKKLDETKTKKKEKKKKKKKNTEQQKNLQHHKPQEAEAARLQSVEARNQQTLQNKKLIQNALRGLDTSNSAANTSNNKIRFSDSGESEGDETKSKDKDDAKKLKKKKKKSLLDDDDDEDDGGSSKSKAISFLTNGDDSSGTDGGDSDDENKDVDRFSVKPQFQGEQGKKLFQMQLRYGDDRFKLDERFANKDNLESDSENEEGKDPNKALQTTPEAEAEDMDEERVRNLSVLGKIIGKDLTTVKPKSKNEKRIDKMSTASSNPYERYDPTKSDHSKLEVQTEEKKKKKKKKKEKDIDSDSDNETTSKKKKKTDKQKEEEIASTAPEVSKERFFKVESSLKSLFTSTSSGGDDQQQGAKSSSAFSFLGVVGNADSNNEDGEEDGADESDDGNLAKPIKEVSWKQGLEEARSNFGGGGSDQEMNADEDVSLKDGGNDSKDEKTVGGEVLLDNEDTFSGSCFFFKEDDERFQKGSKFRRTEEMEEIVKQWKNMRHELHDDFKKKHKDAVRSVRKMKDKKRIPVR